MVYESSVVRTQPQEGMHFLLVWTNFCPSLLFGDLGLAEIPLANIIQKDHAVNKEVALFDFIIVKTP